MLFKKSNIPQGGVPFWLRWAVLGVLAFMFLTSYQNRSAEESHRQTSYNENHGQATRSTPGNTITFAGRSVRQNSSHAGVQIGGNIEGRGAAASCGEKAKVSVETLLPEGVVLTDEQKERLIPAINNSVRVGLHSEDAQWAAGISGMQTDGVREILLPADTVLGEEIVEKFGVKTNEKMRYKITLHSLTPTYPEGSLPFRAMDAQIGRGARAICGATAKIMLTLWNAKGEKIYTSSEPVSFVIGASEYSYGLDRGVLGMQAGGERTLTIPPAYQARDNNASSGASKDALAEKLNSDALIIVDVTLVSVEKP